MTNPAMARAPSWNNSRPPIQDCGCWMGSRFPERYQGRIGPASSFRVQAKGDLLLFTDADTNHREDMISSVVTTLLGENADLLTGFPRQEVQSWGERILVPFFSWVILCFIPLSLAYRLNLSFLSSGVGQFMLFRREAYQAIGGHESVSASIVEDISLVRRIKSSKLRWRMIHLADLTSCRMYQDSREAIDGFTKNLFAVFDYRLIPFLFAFVWLLVLFWEPFILLAIRGICNSARADRYLHRPRLSALVSNLYRSGNSPLAGISVSDSRFWRR